jgi:hypothetical protein
MASARSLRPESWHHPVMLAWTALAAFADPRQVSLAVADGRVPHRVTVEVVTPDGVGEWPQAPFPDGEGTVEVPASGALVVVHAGRWIGAGWAGATGAVTVELAEPGCTYVDADERPIPGLGLPFRGVVRYSDADGHAACGEGTLTLPGGAPISGPLGTGTIRLAARRIDVPLEGAWITPPARWPRPDDGHGLFGRWMPIGTSVEESVADGVVRRRPVDVLASGDPVVGAWEVPPAVRVNVPADAGGSLIAGPYAVVAVDGGGFDVYPRAWPLTVIAWAPGGLGGSAVVVEGTTAIDLPLDADGGPRRLEAAELSVKRRVMPDYPDAAKASANGDVACVTRIFVDAAGLPLDVAFEDCPAVYRGATRDALMQWQWYAPEVDGVAVPVQFVMRVQYRLS